MTDDCQDLMRLGEERVPFDNGVSTELWSGPASLSCQRAPTLGSRIDFDPQRNDNQIPKNSGNESDPRVPLEPSFRPWGPRT